MSLKKQRKTHTNERSMDGSEMIKLNSQSSMDHSKSEV